MFTQHRANLSNLDEFSLIINELVNTGQHVHVEYINCEQRGNEWVASWRYMVGYNIVVGMWEVEAPTHDEAFASMMQHILLDGFKLIREARPEELDDGKEIEGRQREAT